MAFPDKAPEACKCMTHLRKCKLSADVNVKGSLICFICRKREGEVDMSRVLVT